MCDPDRIQTCNLLIRSQMLYSVELRGHSVESDCKNTTFLESHTLEKIFFICFCFVFKIVDNQFLIKIVPNFNLMFFVLFSFFWPCPFLFFRSFGRIFSAV